MLEDQTAYKLKVKKLLVEYNNDRLPDTDFIHSFLPRVHAKLNHGKIPLSDREKEVIDDLFDKY